MPESDDFDDPRVRAAVQAHAEQVLAGQQFAPLDPAQVRTRALRRARGPRLGLAAAAVLAVGLLIAPLGTRLVGGLPAVPAAPPADTGLAACVAGLQDADVDRGSASVSTGEPVLVGYVEDSFRDGNVATRNVTYVGSDPTVTDLVTGQVVELESPSAAAALWKSIQPDVLNGDFGGSQAWLDRVNREPARLVDDSTGELGLVWYELPVDLAVEVNCNGQTRSVRVRGTAGYVPGAAEKGRIEAFACDGVVVERNEQGEFGLVCD